jgi:hypothetical protein
MTPHGHHQLFESFFDPDVIRVEIFGFQNLLVCYVTFIKCNKAILLINEKILFHANQLDYVMYEIQQ